MKETAFLLLLAFSVLSYFVIGTVEDLQVGSSISSGSSPATANMIRDTSANFEILRIGSIILGVVSLIGLSISLIVRL
jgi:hypothetical protein